jgi:VWFA-related protein
LVPDPAFPGRDANVEYTGLTISKRVDEVNLVFTVTDKHGKFVDDLPPNGFQLFDNRQELNQYKYFRQQTGLPMRVALLIDLSDSIRGRFKFEKQAASMFLKHILRPNIDKAMVIGFDGNVHVVHDLTADPKVLGESISKLKAGGNTAFYDAVAFAAKSLRGGSDDHLTRRAIIVISDGVDTASKGTIDQAREEALRSEVVVFALTTASALEPECPGNVVLRQLTGWTGGHVLPAHETADLKSAFRHVEKAMRSQYALGYQLPESATDGSFRSVEIVPRKRGLKVQCRKGYFAPREIAKHE